MPPDDATPAVRYGPDIATEAELRLCGDVRGKRVLELGCGDGHNAVAFARQGAIAIGIDASGQALTAARQRAAEEGVRLELYEGDLADLPFARADTIDVVFSAQVLGDVDDINRVFRQVHRVLKPGALFVFSVPHPARFLVDLGDPDRPTLAGRSYFDTSPFDTAHQRTIGDIFTGLVRSGFRVDTVLEPEPVRGPGLVPSTLVMRARKEGL